MRCVHGAARGSAETLVRIIESERIGARTSPADFLHVTFKDTDTAGHHHGNGSPEFYEALRAADRGLGRVIAALERQTGPGGLVVLVTADHGGLPEKLRKAGARVPEKELEKWLLERLPVKAGAGPWLREVEWVTQLAANDPRICGIVARVMINAGDQTIADRIPSPW